MKALFILTCAICCCHFLLAQDTTLKKNYYLKAQIWETNKTLRYSYVADVNDTALFLSGDAVKFRQGGLMASPLAYQQIDVIKLKRKGSVGRGLWKGAVGGAVLGGLIGAITYRKCDNCILDFGPGLDITAGAILGAGGGALIGAIAGAIAGKRFTIGGRKEKFDQMRLSVLDMTYKK